MEARVVGHVHEKDGYIDNVRNTESFRFKSCGASDRWPPLVSLILVASPVQGSAHASTETRLGSLGGLPHHFPVVGRNDYSGRERERQLVSAEQPFTAR
jgi:hypothetical protein